MHISMNDETIQTLRSMLEEKGKSAVRLVIKGFGWAGPTFGVVLDEQKEDDDSIEVDGINVVAEKEFSFLFEDAKVILSKSYFGTSFNVISGSATTGNCR